jgi:predicted DNA binding CopG/RHH family protein
MPRKTEMPKFKNEDEEADWWASAAGRHYVESRAKLAQAKGIKFAGSRLLARLSEKRTTQIAIRLPGDDIEVARRIAGRKGIGYQTLLRMIVHEGLQREARRSFSARKG